MSFFAGGASSFVTTGSAVMTSGFSTPTSTSTQPAVVDERTSSEVNVAEWIRTPEAQAHAGRWVLLSPELQVLDSDESPSDLLARHPGESAPTVVFVDPSAKQYAL